VNTQSVALQYPGIQSQANASICVVRGDNTQSAQVGYTCVLCAHAVVQTVVNNTVPAAAFAGTFLLVLIAVIIVLLCVTIRGRHVNKSHTLLRNEDATPPVSRAHSESELQQDWQREQTLVPALSYRTPREKQRALQVYVHAHARAHTHLHVQTSGSRLRRSRDARARRAHTYTRTIDGHMYGTVS
jgi:hypothetical protein